MHRPLASVLVIAAIMLIVALAVVVTTDSTGRFINSPAGSYLDRPFPASDGMPCDAHTYCIAGLACLNGYCQKQQDYVIYPTELCERDAQCAYGYFCIEGRCQIP